MSQAQIDNLLNFSTPFDDEKLQTFDLVAQHLQSNVPQSVSPHISITLQLTYLNSTSLSDLTLDRLR